MVDLSILKVLMQRDGMTKADALGRIAVGKARVEDGEDPEEVLYDEFGLEPDYLFDLLD